MKKRYERVARFVFISLFSGVFTFAKSGAVNSFSSGFASALILCRPFAFPTALGFIVGKLAGDFSFWSALESTILVLISCIFSLFLSRRRKKITPFFALVCCLSSFSGSIVRAIIENTPFFFVLANAVAILVTCYITFTAFSPLANNEGELSKVCALAVLSVFYCAVSVLGAEYSLLLPVCLLLGKAYGKTGAIVSAIAVGVGQSLFSFSPNFLALAVFCVAVGSIFITLPRPLTVLGSVMAVIVFRLYFFVSESGLITDLILLVVGGVLYCAVPLSAIKRLEERSIKRSATLSLKFLLSLEREKYTQRLLRLGECFFEMSRAINGTISPLAPESVKQRLVREVCSTCNACNQDCLDTLCKVVSEKERADASEVPDLLSVGCRHSARLISLASEVASLNAYYKRKNKAEEMLKREVSFHLESVASVIAKSGEESFVAFSFDNEKEILLADEMRHRGIGVVDAIVKTGADGEVIVVLSSKPNEEEIVSVISAVMESKFFVERKTREAKSGLYILSLKEKPPYEVVFSASGISKSTMATGDTHSFIRIGERKFMMALCDGMGSGKKAGDISERAIELVESYFRVGLPNEFIISSVNRFLSKQSDESFCAFDILVCDLFSLERTIIKLGTPRSFIKQAEGVTALDGNALPLGVVEEIKPFIRTDRAKDGDTVIFVSDGVSDTFSGNELGELILDGDERNLKNYTDKILSVAKLHKKGVPTDDMTVISARIVRRI